MTEYLPRRLLWASVFSLLLHLCLFISNLSWLRPKAKAPKPSSPSEVIRFNLIEPPLVMETPELEKEEAPPKPGNIISDKNIAARDKLDKQENINDSPYAEGKSKIKDLMEKKGSPGQDQVTTPPVKPALAGTKALPEKPEALRPPLPPVPKSAEEKSNIEVVSPEDVIPKEIQPKEMVKEGEEIDRREEIARLQKEPIHIPLYDDRLSNARSFGEVTFNAKKHEVAPYIIKMKKKIEEHWAPPVLFTYYGLTSGETVVQFKIMPDGQVRDLKVLQEKGDESLKKSSLQAIQDAGPFEPVPPQVLAGEKEKYLGITFTFYYIIDKPGEKSAEGDEGTFN